MLDHRRVQDVIAERAVVDWSDTADAALSRMCGLDCDRLAVIDPHGVVGLCERSALLACQQRGNWLGSIAVADLMRRGPFWCRDDDPPAKVLGTMQQLGIDTLAVLDRRGRVIGTVSRSRLVTEREKQPTAGPVSTACH